MSRMILVMVCVDPCQIVPLTCRCVISLSRPVLERAGRFYLIR